MTNLLNLFTIQQLAEQVGFKLHNLLVWEKNNANANRWYMKNCEYVLFMRKGNAKTINNPSSKTVHKFNNIIGNKIHPTEKPVELMELYILNSSKEGEIVLDPFMGSCSTGVAAVNTNRKFIGIEMDDNYFSISVERIKKHEKVLEYEIYGK
jgi:site-specific DNA-methyltransferase (adenine-specific)